MTNFIKTTVEDVEDTAEAVIDDIISGLGALSPLGSLITAILSLCGVSTGNLASVLSFVTALYQFLTKWQDRLVMLITNGFSSSKDLVSFCKGLWQLFSDTSDADDAADAADDSDTDSTESDSDADTDTQSDTESDVTEALARIFAGKSRFGAVSKTAAESSVSDMQGYIADVRDWMEDNSDADCTCQRAAVQALAAKWKQTQAARLSPETADSVAAA